MVIEQNKEHTEVQVERFEMGDGRFVEKHGNDRLVVGARTSSEADLVVDAWQKEVKRREEEAQYRAQQEAERLQRERLEALAEEQRRLEEQAEQARQELRAQKERREQEAQARMEQEAKRAQEVRERAERARRAEAERLQKEQEELERKQTLDRFCQAHGFVGINEPRRSGCSVWASVTTYPLLVAAELGEETIVEMLLKEGVDPNQTNSSGKSAEQVAAKKNKGGSHEGVLRLLRGEPQVRIGGA